VLGKDVFVNVVGGLRVEETALDLGVCLAVASSACGRPLPEGTAVFGEVGLTGEVRSVSRPEARVAEALQMGFSRIVLPASAARAVSGQVELLAVRSVREALRLFVVSSGEQNPRDPFPRAPAPAGK
jgi:DNA repair protein RadA/Sms